MSEPITVKDLLAAHARRGTSLASETALFIVLEAADAMRETPGAVTVDDVRISSEGEVSIAPPPTGGESAALASLATMAERLVRPLPASARSTFDRIRSGEITSLASARAGIEALLVPLNRAAARRVLGRLARETVRTPTAEKHALATDPTGAPASALDTAPDSVPPFPPPPRMADLHAIPGAPSAVDTAPDGTPSTVSGAVRSDRASRGRGMVPVIVALLVVTFAAIAWFVFARLP